MEVMVSLKRFFKMSTVMKCVVHSTDHILVLPFHINTLKDHKLILVKGGSGMGDEFLGGWGFRNVDRLEISIPVSCTVQKLL